MVPELKLARSRILIAAGDPQKETPGRPGLKFSRLVKSVTGRDRCSPAAEAVVKAYGDHVHVLADPVVEYGHKARILVCSACSRPAQDGELASIQPGIGARMRLKER